ncbi:CAP domain-containing protein [Streptomyces sp. NPDC003717]|uniref:CAP domain-containing protein n=1 Tax=Streptomyces sp. NPDC003717 TaxID=3154276 RepID=UPI0033B2D429
MGRHRRSAAGSAGRDHAAPAAPEADAAAPTPGIAPYLNPEAYAEARARSDAYLFASDDAAGDGPPEAGRTVPFPSGGFTPDEGPRRPSTHRRRRRGARPVRAGLLGVSAAVALGTVAVATGAMPGLDNYRLGGTGKSDDHVRSADAATNTPVELGGTSGNAETPVDPGAGHPAAPSAPDSPAATTPGEPSASPTPSAPTTPPATTPSADKPSAERSAERPSKKTQSPRERTSEPETTAAPTPSRPAAPPAPAATTAPAGISEQAAAEAQVVKLVNDERAQAGCRPVAANSALRDLAEDFSDAMAAQGFFDHTDPSGATPWDRADAAGISGLGGENIARGQADAQAVMAAWMDSPGHRANILNCDFTTLGAGVHFGAGGPWWTQDFGY